MKRSRGVQSYVGNTKETWADIPQSILEQVIEQLDPISYHAILGVCSWWRRLARKNPRHKDRTSCLLLMFSGDPSRDARLIINFSLDPARSNPYGWRFCGYFDNWVALIHPTRKVFLLDLITRFVIKLPHQITMPFEHQLHHPLTDPFLVRKVLLSTTPTKADCKIIAITSHYKIMHCVVGDQQWSSIPMSTYPQFDAAFIDRNLYMFDFHKGVMKYQQFPIGAMTTLSIMPELHVEIGAKYLVAYEQELMLVMRTRATVTMATIGFRVFVLEEQYHMEEQDHMWREINDLGRRMILLNKSCSLCVPFDDNPDLEENCIYFVGHSKDGGRKNGVFRMSDKTIRWVEDGEKSPLLLSLFHHKSLF